jgi:hypothetical protein
MCVDDQILSSYIDGELSDPWKAQIEEHLEWCDACRLRYNAIKGLHEKVKESVISDDSIGLSQNRVMRYLNANVLNKEKHTWLQKLHKIVSKKVLLPICSAALTFCFCLIFLNPSGKVNDLFVVPDSPSLSIDNIVPVRLSDNYTTSQSIENYSLEEIIRYLDESGYDVTIRSKSIQPIKTESSVYVPVPMKIDLNPKEFKSPSDNFIFSFKTR